MKKILHICAGWEKWNGAANIARLIMGEQKREGHDVSFATWAGIGKLRSADEVWIHCSWKPCLWWAALWGRNIHWMPECSYDPIRRAYHGWKKTLVGPIERACLRRAKALVATCEAEKRWIEAYLGKHCPPIVVTDIKRFFCLPNSRLEALPSNRPLHLLYLGRRHPLKGIEYLEAAGRQIQNTSALSASRHLCVRFVSNISGEELEKVWDWCDVLVLPTLSDNFGLVIAEALERGKRVITTDGAPAWGPEECGNMEMLQISNSNIQSGSGIWEGYGGRLLYLKGYREGSDEERVRLLNETISKLALCADDCGRHGPCGSVGRH